MASLLFVTCNLKPVEKSRSLLLQPDSLRQVLGTMFDLMEVYALFWRQLVITALSGSNSST